MSELDRAGENAPETIPVYPDGTTVVRPVSVEIAPMPQIWPPPATKPLTESCEVKAVPDPVTVEPDEEIVPA